MIKKKYNILMCSIFSALMIMGSSSIVFASETNNLQSAYDNVMSYAKENGIDLSTTYEEFISDYHSQPIQEYEQSFYDIFSLQTNNAVPYTSGSDKYYYNTGTTCPSEATYKTYNLLDVVKKGDIIYESEGGGGITGYIAIVEGIFTRSDGTKYIRLIEAIKDGVVRSILDDKRADEKGVSILRAITSEEKRNSAVKFCIGELGSKYWLDVPAKDTSSSETDWYCSELVWAAYYNQGIDIETIGPENEPGITPHDILNSSNVYKVPYSIKWVWIN